MLKGSHPTNKRGAPSAARFAFRGFFVQDAHFAAAYPTAFTAMNLNAMECATFSGSSNTQLTAHLDAISAPHTGWIYFGSGYVPGPAPGGGTFAITDAKLDSLMTTVGAGGYAAKNHPRNSHRYQVFDELSLLAYSGANLQANLDKIKARVDRIKGHDPLAICACTDFRQAQLDPTATPGAIWVGVFDEVWLDGYPNWVPYQETTIPNQAAWCDAAGIPYVGVPSCHAFGTNQPAYPTTTVFTHTMDQWKATNARGINLYIWDDGIAPSLSTDSTMQAHIGVEMAAVS